VRGLQFDIVEESCGVSCRCHLDWLCGSRRDVAARDGGVCWRRSGCAGARCSQQSHCLG
jgi:hypothetical protein